MSFTYLHPMQGEKKEAWFLFEAIREYFAVETKAFPSASKLTKKSAHW